MAWLDDQNDKVTKGSLILHIRDDEYYTVKYLLQRGNKYTVVVNNGRYDFPIPPSDYILITTPLLEELL